MVGRPYNVRARASLYTFTQLSSGNNMALASLRVLLLLALWSVQRSLGDITEIELHHEPDDYVELTFRDDGPLDTFHQVSRLLVRA